MRGYLREHLLGSDSRASTTTQSLDRAVAEHLDGRQNHEKLLVAAES